ncbi:amidohydrolase family protein [Hydrogenophaga sp.]|uniref:amidohydrolase family protein n=1 Tax=Hydrogenophaga sp. TaxID=1904254 RepID=UPI0027170E18|nr:amidohydrolase family protein [Hydrogenophaga sp.]MDO8905325.1 amidohydrolase family protein [Hydrogenophaga sp.]
MNDITIAQALTKVFATPAPAYLPFKAGVKWPSRALPAGTCDCHFHIFEPTPQGTPAYPFAEPRSYTPTPASLGDYRTMINALGIERAVLVHPSVYGSDHSSFEHWLTVCGSWMRGVAVAKPDTPLADIERWHRLGARGTRCNALFDGGVPEDAIPRIVDRVRAFGWHLQVLMNVNRDPRQVIDLAALGVPLVVDHCGHVPASEALDSPGFNNLLALVREGRAWVKLSGLYRLTPQRTRFSDAEPLVEALMRANMAQLVWGSDWPHPAIAPPMVDDGDLVQTLLDACSDEELQQILVDNPTRLYWSD